MLLIIFLLTLTDMLQSGMMAFAAGPLMGETGTSPEQYSFITASYACVAILMISKQRWIVERTGWRLYIAVSLMIFAVGAFMCSKSNTYHSLLTGRIVMAAGGASFLTGARVMVNLIPPAHAVFRVLKLLLRG
ncbi:MFS transporter [Mangrovibacter sp. SLW1]